LRRVTEQRARQVVGGRSKVGMVQDVEKLGPETEPRLLRDAKDTLEPDIRLRGIESAQHVAPEIPLSSNRRWDKSSFVERLTTGIASSKQLQRYCGIYVRAGIQGGAWGLEERANDVNRRGRPGEHKSIDRPAAH